MEGRTFLRTCLTGAVFAVLFSAQTWAGKPVASVSDSTIANGVYVEGVDLSGMTPEEAENALQAKADSMASTPVNLKYGDNVITASLADFGYACTNLDIVDSLVPIGKSGNIVERYKQQKDLENHTVEYTLDFTVDEQRVRNFVKTLSSYDTDPVEGELLIGSDGLPYVEGGTRGTTLKAEESAAAVKAAIEAWTGGNISVELSYDEVSPDVTYETLSLVKDVLGTATTDYSASSGNRAVNVENGCALINGTLLWPGDEFSVTQAVTPFSAENGYLPAPTYEENRTVDSYGGGICQVSTTLYNAALKAELDITARSNHTMMVSYVEPSKDAAIAEGVMDMRFVNNTDAPIYIQGGCYGGQITFVIYGHETRPANRTIEFDSRVLATMEPSGYSLYPDATQAVGYIAQTQSPHTGYQAELWKLVYVDGVQTDEVLVNSSYYQSVGTIYSVGVMTSNAAVQQALYGAIGSNNLDAVQQIIRYGVSAQQPQTGAQGQAQGTDPAQASGANQAQQQGTQNPQGQTAGDMDDNMDPGAVTIIN